MKQPLHALVIDDEPLVGGFVAEILASDGWSVSEVRNADRALEMLPEQKWSLVFCDVQLDGADGYTVLRRFSEKQSDARFVLMTGHGSAAGALDAIAFGAYDYLVKPFAVEDILNIARGVREQQTNRSGEKAAASDGYVSDILLIGKSPKFVECLKMVGRIAATNLPVLITGESGTGKEIVAQTIHRRSSRANDSFVAVNCGAIPFELIESELFGHARGAFTGASSDRKGLWEEADGGTILLDEITETSSLFQVKLLRALQQGEIRRVGSNQTVKVNVRVVAATNRDIEEEVREGRFRQDLMYRLNAVMIHLPPLRERREDVPLLADYFARKIRPADAAPVAFSAAALEIMENYRWRGNVRELENAVCHAVSLCGDVVYPHHLPTRLRQTNEAPPERIQNADASAAHADEWHSLAEMETAYAARVLAHTNGNKQAAARLLNIDRKTLARVVKRADRAA